MTDKPARYLRLRDHHPTMQKLEKLFALAEELGIRIEFSDHGPAIVYDRDRDKNLPDLSLQDLDSPDYPMSSLPPTLEYKVIYGNPEYLAQEEKEQEEYRKKKDEEEKARREKEQKRIERENKARRRDRIVELQRNLSRNQHELEKLLKEEGK